MVELREPSGVGTGHPTRYGAIFSYALHVRRRLGFLLREAYFPRREWWVNAPELACEWGLLLLYLSVFPRRPWDILRQVYVPRPLIQGYRSAAFGHGRRVSGLCLTVRPDKILRRYSDHQLIFGISLFRRCLGHMVMGRVCR